MKEKELFEQLHNLSKLQPDADWKKSQRELMLRQINASHEEVSDAFSIKDFLSLPINALQNLSQPVMATFMVAFLILTSGFVGLRASQETKPGDSLYVAKIVGEKTQLALTFNDKKKAQLVLEFAMKRAEELKYVASVDSGEDKDEKVEKLVEGLKKDIDDAKQRIERITVADASQDEEGQVEEEPVVDEEEVVEEVPEEEIFTAGSEKEDSGLEVSSGSRIKKSKTPQTSSKIEISDVIDELKDEEEVATTSEEQVETTEVVEEPEAVPQSPEEILEQASAMLEKENYDQVFDILTNAGSVLDEKYDSGEVKGVEESVDVDEVGTSTEQ